MIPVITVPDTPATMKVSHTLQSLYFASFTLAHPAIPENLNDRALPSPTSSAILAPSATPTPPIDTRLGRAVIDNNCQTPIYLWSVGTVTRPSVTVLPGIRYGETFRHDHNSGGIAIKISTEQNGLYDSAPLTVFAYNLNGDNVWYDLSDVFGDPFKGHSVVLSPAEPPIHWADGIPPAGSQVRVRNASDDLVLTLC